jgi:ubiquinone/menaquinone biosynthesis C-methylase UbiE
MHERKEQAEKRRPRRPREKPGKPASPATHWGGVANWYDNLVGDEGTEYQRQVVLPGVVRLLALKPGDACVDVACGQGVLCRTLADKGVHVTGVDAAVELVNAARARLKAVETETGKRPPIDYHVGDARDLSFPAESSFDAAACVLAIQNINPIGPVFAGVARALKPWGRFVLVMMHPCFRGPKETAWGWDEKAGVQFRRVDRYLLPRKSPIVTHPGKDPDTYTWTFHKPIEAYARGLRGAGLLIDSIEEWPSHKTSTSGPKAAAENAARKEIPMFLAIRAVKASAPGSPLNED